MQILLDHNSSEFLEDFIQQAYLRAPIFVSYHLDSGFKHYDLFHTHVDSSYNPRWLRANSIMCEIWQSTSYMRSYS